LTKAIDYNNLLNLVKNNLLTHRIHSLTIHAMHAKTRKAKTTWICMCHPYIVVLHYVTLHQIMYYHIIW